MPTFIAVRLSPNTPQNKTKPQRRHPPTNPTQRRSVNDHSYQPSVSTPLPRLSVLGVSAQLCDNRFPSFLPLCFLPVQAKIPIKQDPSLTHLNATFTNHPQVLIPNHLHE